MVAKFYRALARKQDNNFNETHYERLMNLIGACANMGMYQLTLHRKDVTDKEIEYLRDDDFTVDGYYDVWTINWK